MEYVVRCTRCSEPLHSEHRKPFSGRCGHSQCEDCAKREITCPVANCYTLSSFAAPMKNFLMTDYLVLIEKEEERIIEVKKGIDRDTSMLAYAVPLPPARQSSLTAASNPPKKLSNGNGNPVVKTKEENKMQTSTERHGIIVTNLPPITEEMLRNRFGGKDKLLQCDVCVGFDQQPSGEAYLWYAKREDAEKVVKHNHLSSISGTNKEKKKMKVEHNNKK